MNINNVYIGGALTRLDQDIRPYYEMIAKICADYDIKAYVPHLMGTDPIANPEVTPEYVWQKDHEEVTKADLIIAYVGQASLGTGGELEIARMAGKKIILWWFSGEKVSRLPRGNPAVVAQIVANDDADICEQIKKFLSENN